MTMTEAFAMLFGFSLGIRLLVYWLVMREAKRRKRIESLYPKNRPRIDQ